MPFRCKWAFPREEKCLLDLLQSVLHFHSDVCNIDVYASSIINYYGICMFLSI
jgi:hypothetical protein